MDPELYAAAQLGNWVVMERFSDSFYSQHTPVKDTVLHVLSQSCDSANVVQLILAGHGRLLMKLNKQGETALHLAAKKGHLRVVRALIDYAKSEEGYQPAPYFESFDRCKLMMRMPSNAGNTALHEAVRNNFYDIAKLLVQEDPEFRYPHNYAVETPLYLAVEKGHHNIMVLILESCKTPSYLGPGHKTALHAAAIWNLPESTELILEKLPNLIRKGDRFGWTALHYAAKFNHQEIASLLLSAKRSTAYVTAKNDDFKTALHIAVIHGHVALVQEILSRCPDCWVQYTGKGQNILHLAVKHERREVLEFVLQNSWASDLINRMDHEGNTPLHLYVATKNLDGNSLVNHPFVDINSFDNSNSTPLDRIVEEDKLSERQVEDAFPPSPLHDHTDFISGRRVCDDAARILSIIILIRYELEQAGGTRGYRNVATVKKNLRVPKPDELKRVEKLAGNYLIVATLIATVTFAAGFTIPGGYYSDGPHKGMAVLRKKPAFITFVISDFLAMIASIDAVLAHLRLVQTKRYGRKLVFVGIIRVRISQAVTLMMIAFLTGLYAVQENLAVMIVLCAFTAWFSVAIYLVWPKRKDTPLTYVTKFKHSEADYLTYRGPFIRWHQDLTEAAD